MHSIKNISERNKIDTQSRANTYIRRKRLIRKSDYNLKFGCTQKYSWNWKKTLITLSSGQKNPKNPKKNKKHQKTPKKPQKNHWAGFLKKKPGLFEPCILVYLLNYYGTTLLTVTVLSKICLEAGIGSVLWFYP
jgi:hypothetical protein